MYIHTIRPPFVIHGACVFIAPACSLPPAPRLATLLYGGAERARAEQAPTSPQASTPSDRPHRLPNNPHQTPLPSLFPALTVPPAPPPIHSRPPTRQRPKPKPSPLPLPLPLSALALCPRCFALFFSSPNSLSSSRVLLFYFPRGHSSHNISGLLFFRTPSAGRVLVLVLVAPARSFPSARLLRLRRCLPSPPTLAKSALAIHSKTPGRLSACPVTTTHTHTHNSHTAHPPLPIPAQPHRARRALDQPASCCSPPLQAGREPSLVSKVSSPRPSRSLRSE